MKFDENSTKRFRTLLNGFAVGENIGRGPFFLAKKKKNVVQLLFKTSFQKG